MPHCLALGIGLVEAGEIAKTAQVAQHGPVLGAQIAVGFAQVAHAHQPARHALTHAGKGSQLLLRGAQHPAHAAKARVQSVRQIVDVAAGHGVKEQQLQKLVRTQRLRALQPRPAAQPLAMAQMGAILQ